MTSYLPIDQFQIVDLAGCDDGFFQGLPGPFENVIVATHGGVRQITYLDDPKGVRTVSVARGEGRSTPGILWTKPNLEVDPATRFNPDRADMSIGDLILGSTPCIVTLDPEGWNELQRTPLWPSDRTDDRRLGFKSWRIVNVHDDERRILYDRVAKPSA